MTSRIAFRVRQSGQTVACVEGDDHISAEAEIMHYARLYREEGDVAVQHNAAGHWKRFALLCQWSPARSTGEVQ